ncbi:TY-Chap domain-containing protein [Pseudarthrobacter sp. Y6]|uniref:TY-Chap domain-containing protein n=1 Tax=Pseudarthrobacter sp. Y6 TaxID=3418422 RepID=UPI003CEC78FC
MTTQRFGPLPATDGQALIAQVVNGFLAGDPVWSIADAANMSSWEVMGVLSSRIAERGEDQRSKALQNRCSLTAEVLYQNDERIWQLLDAGIEGKDIPKVLAALGASIDLEIAVELLCSPETFKDIHVATEVVVLPRPTDRFSLLYVVGRHRGVEPDYKFALGKVPLPGIDELRRSLVLHSAEPQIAEIIATVETTAQAIKIGDVTGISYSAYTDTATALAHDPGNAGLTGWLVPASGLRDGLGGGFWSDALEAVGLTLPSTPARFNRADYQEASKAFLTAYSHFGSPKDVASFDSWVIAETAAGRDRPSLIAIRRHFGAWESVIGAVMPPEVEDEFPGMVRHLREENAVEERWARAGELVSEVLANMPWNSFVSIDYGDEADGPRRPYAQANPSADGVWCEIVSEAFLPAVEWPIDTNYLVGNGWSAPDEEVPNWHKQGVPPFEAGHQLLEALKHGRLCRDPQKVRWHSGDFPGGPGPDGGVILDFEPGGVVRNLRRAS